MFNRTFFRNALFFVVILAVGFAILFAAEYFRAKTLSETKNGIEVYSDCITDTGDPC